MGLGLLYHVLRTWYNMLSFSVSAQAGRKISIRNIITAMWLLYHKSLPPTSASGNMFDSMFYGLIFNASSEFYTSYIVPFGTGYAPFLMGKVVDMFYFPLIVTTWPDWVPYVGGNPYVFFSPIFNFADSSISVGVVLLLLFYRKEISEIKFGNDSKKEIPESNKE